MRSSRLPSSLAPNALSRAVAARRAAGLDLIDLTESNPTRAGIAYPQDLLAPLADPAGLVYSPDPLGLPSAREQIALLHSMRTRSPVSPGRVAITASTSEAYALLFKLFCDPGDAVLVPTPSYPLFEHLTRLEGVRAVPYALEYHGAWRIDMASIERALDSRARALLVVSPNNPTGSFLHRDDLRQLVVRCRDADLALIGDEVFFDYPLDPAPAASSVLDQDEVVTCALGGLSKYCGLPQVKLAWIVWSGPGTAVDQAIEAYEIIADSYLSVSTPAQVAARRLLADTEPVRQQIDLRIRRNLSALRQASAEWPAASVLRVEGGWSAVVQVPATRSEEDLAVTLVANDGVLVHPGFFFDFPREAYVVVSLLVEPERFDAGVSRLLARACGSSQ